ncbi:hypothetical protein ZEAMMB73_Zm00001d047571 [Zea mays]|uniref:Uncharacterized protein n=1 Tax=Zea mays TaxID=4577 RepID=A0A1D6PBM0_MAIZE|nr:hypothetical protein ZEAMMB73_Zm00001d047571 [Zea mays]
MANVNPMVVPMLLLMARFTSTTTLLPHLLSARVRHGRARRHLHSPDIRPCGSTLQHLRRDVSGDVCREAELTTTRRYDDEVELLAGDIVQQRVSDNPRVVARRHQQVYGHEHRPPSS